MDKTVIKYSSLIKKLVPINGLPPQYQNEIINHSQVLTYRKRQQVFKQGDRDNWGYYLLSGELELSANGELVKQLTGGSDGARHALAQLQPRQMTARALGPVTVLRVDRHLLDRLLTLDDKSDIEGEVEVSEIESEESGDWMTRLLQSELFARIPAANIQKIFTTMEPVTVSAGEVVVEQGTPGDYYYLVQTGRCEVIRRSSKSAHPIKLAELAEGDTFGEEALVSDATRNASIVMLTDGELMRLTKSDFVDLIRNPVLESVSYLMAESLIAKGANWLDVRFPEEHQESGMEGSLNIPLNVLRLRQRDLEPETTYVLYCDTGARSSVAAFLLTQSGFDVRYLKGGLMQTPMAPERAARTSAPKGAPPTADVSPRVESGRSETAAGEKQPATASAEPEALEPTIRASVLDTELAKANLQLEAALRQKAGAEQARNEAEEMARRRLKSEREKLEAQAKRLRTEAEAAKRKVAEAARGQIRQERERLEAEAKRLKDEALTATRAAEEIADQRIAQERERLEAKAAQANEALQEAQRLKREIETARTAALAEAEELRRQEERRIEQLQEAAERRLREESAKLEAEYARNAAELERVRGEREEAEARLREEREKMEQQTANARRKLDEARRIKRETEASRRAVETEVEQKRREQAELERRLREEVDKKIREERRKLEAEFARHAQEMELAQREREAAEAARIAAQEEAERIIAEYESEHAKTVADHEAKLRLERERIIAEYESEHAKTVAEHEAKLRRERKRIEKEAKEVQAALEQARRAREEADATRRAAEARMEELRQAELKAARSKKAQQGERLKAEIAAIDAEVNDAKQQLQAAERVHQAAVAANRVNQSAMARQSDAEAELHRRLELEAKEWQEEQERLAREGGRARDLIMDAQIERIKKRAAEAKRRAREANANLLTEIETQLGASEG